MNLRDAGIISKLYFGNRRMTLPGLGELKTGTFHSMCKQLGINPKEL